MRCTASRRARVTSLRRSEAITSSDSKATRRESWTKPNACWPSRLFPPEATAKWEKEHGRLERRRIKRVAVTPEEIGLCGCWQVIAMERVRIELTKPARKHASAKDAEQPSPKELWPKTHSLATKAWKSA